MLPYYKSYLNSYFMHLSPIVHSLLIYAMLLQKMCCSDLFPNQILSHYIAAIGSSSRFFVAWQQCEQICYLELMYFTKAFLGESNIVPLHSTGTQQYNSQKPPPTSISRNRAERSRLSTILLGIVCKKIIETPIIEFQAQPIQSHSIIMSFWGRSLKETDIFRSKFISLLFGAMTSENLQFKNECIFFS